MNHWLPGIRISRPDQGLVGRSGVARRVVAALWVGTLLLTGTAPSSAHGVLQRSVPAAGAHLSAAPTQLRLTFNERVELAMARLVLVGPGGEVVLGPLSLVPDSNRIVVAPILGRLSGGSYTVRWQVAGADGHPVRGEYAFVIAPGATGVAPDPGPAAPGQAAVPPEHHDPSSLPSGPGFDAESPLYAAIRWLTYLALVGVIGAVAFRFAVLLPLERRDDAATASVIEPAARAAAEIGLAAASLLALAAVLRLLAQSYAMHGSGVLDSRLVGTMLSRTLWGWGWVLQVVATAIALLGFSRARRHVTAPAVAAPEVEAGGEEDDLDVAPELASRSPRTLTAWAIAAASVPLLALFPALSGHAASAPRWGLLTVIADMLHVIGAGGWIGGLFLLLFAGVRAAQRLESADRGPAVGALVGAFSPTALAFAGLLTVTGGIAALVHLGSIPALWGSGYGRTLMLKLGLLTVVFGTGAYNWRRVRPALGNVAGTRRLRGSATVEIAVGVLVLAVTAVLVATAPADALTPDSITPTQPAER